MQELIARAEKHRAPPEGPRRDRRRGGILDRRPDFGGAAGAARRVRLLPRRRRRLYPGCPASAARSAGYLGAGHARLDRALCAAAGANRAATLLGELGAGRERSHRAERQSLRRCRPATPASPLPDRSSGRSRSKPAVPTASPTCKPSAPPHSTCCWMCWPVNLRRRPDGTPVRQTAGKVTAKQLPCAES